MVALGRSRYALLSRAGEACPRCGGSVIQGACLACAYEPQDALPEAMAPLLARKKAGLRAYEPRLPRRRA